MRCCWPRCSTSWCQVTADQLLVPKDAKCTMTMQQAGECGLLAGPGAAKRSCSLWDRQHLHCSSDMAGYGHCWPDGTATVLHCSNSQTGCLAAWLQVQECAGTYWVHVAITSPLPPYQQRSTCTEHHSFQTQLAAGFCETQLSPPHCLMCAAEVLRDGWQEWYQQHGRLPGQGLPFDSGASTQLLQHDPFFDVWSSPTDGRIKLMSLK